MLGINGSQMIPMLGYLKLIYMPVPINSRRQPLMPAEARSENTETGAVAVPK